MMFKTGDCSPVEVLIVAKRVSCVGNDFTGGDRSTAKVVVVRMHGQRNTVGAGNIIRREAGIEGGIKRYGSLAIGCQGDTHTFCAAFAVVFLGIYRRQTGCCW